MPRGDQRYPYEREVLLHRRKGKGTEVAVRRPQAKERQEPLEAGRSKGQMTFSCCPWVLSLMNSLSFSPFRRVSLSLFSIG